MNDLEEEEWDAISDSEMKHASKETCVFSSSLQDDIEKAKDISKQLCNFDELVDVRLQLQKSLLLANKLSTGLKFRVISDNADIAEANEIIKENLGSLLKDFCVTQVDLLSVDSSKKIKIDESASLAKTVAKVNAHVLQYAFEEGDKWISKVMLGAEVAQMKFKAINQSLASQIEKGVPLAKPKVLVANSSSSQRDISVAHSNDLCYDDSMVLSHLFPAAFSQRLADNVMRKPKMKKNVDTKASKGRKIRYDVHAKIQNLMTPMEIPCWSAEKTNELFASLFKSKASIEKQSLLAGK